MRYPSFRVVAAIVLSVATSLGTALAQDYFPLEEGILRHYQTTAGDDYSTYFSGTIPVNQTTASILHYSGGPDHGLRQYWSQTQDGDVLFHGFVTLESFSIIWSPPILMVDVPVTVGKLWQSNSSGGIGQTANLQFAVQSIGDITVPAGTYPAVSIATSPILPSFVFAPVSYTGRRYPGELSVALVQDDVRSYSDGVGLISWAGTPRTDELVDRLVVAVENATWSAVRELYR